MIPFSRHTSWGPVFTLTILNNLGAFRKMGHSDAKLMECIMERADIERIFEAYFEKFKKTEGDRTSWSAVWTEMTPTATLDLNLTKCPRGTSFKIFVDKKKVAEVQGWDAYFETMEKVDKEHPGLYEPENIFAQMESII